MKRVNPYDITVSGDFETQVGNGWPSDYFEGYASPPRSSVDELHLAIRRDDKRFALAAPPMGHDDRLKRNNKVVDKLNKGKFTGSFTEKSPIKADIAALNAGREILKDLLI